MQIIRENSAKKNFLLIFAIILCIYSLHATAEIRTFSRDEEKDYGPTEIIQIIGTKVYDDGTIVARIIRMDGSPPMTADKLCFDEILSLRIMHHNDIVEEQDIKLEINSFNHCT